MHKIAEEKIHCRKLAIAISLWWKVHPFALLLFCIFYSQWDVSKMIKKVQIGALFLAELFWIRFSTNMLSGESRGNIIANFVADIKWVTEVHSWLWELDRERGRERARGKERLWFQPDMGSENFPF